MANNIRYFQYMSAYTAAQEAYSIDVPNVSYIQDEDVVKYQEHYTPAAKDVLLKLTDGTYSAVTFSDGNISYNAFKQRTDIEEAYIGSGITSILASAFYGCSAMTYIELSNSLTTISGYALNRCKKIQSLTFPSSVTTIGDLAFWNCDSLSSAIFMPTTPPKGVNETIFSGFSNDLVIYVPSESVEAYKTALGSSLASRVQAIPNS